MMVFLLQDNDNYKPLTICQAVIDRCQLLYENERSHQTRISLKFDSLEIKDHLTDSEDVLVTLNCPTLINLNIRNDDKRHEQYDLKFGTIDMKLVKILSKMTEK